MDATTYQKTISNDKLGVMEEIKGTTLVEIRVKAEKQLARWAGQERRQKERSDLDSLEEMAEYDTIQAEAFIEECGSILQSNLNAGRELEWISLYNDKPFPPFVFKEPVPRYEKIARKIGVPKKNLFAELFLPTVKNRRVNLETEAKQVLDLGLQQYEEKKESARVAHKEQRAAYIEEQSEYNKSVDQLQLDFEKGHPDAIESFIRIALAQITYPDAIKVEFDVQYQQAEKLIIINCIFPGPVELPRTVRYQYNEEEKGITAVEMGQKDFDAFYESVLLQITISSIHILFKLVNSRHIQLVGFNGWVKGADLETAGEIKTCILSCKVSRDVFDSFDLAGTPPGECFANLKGRMVRPLTGLIPVQPIVDKRQTVSLYTEIGQVSTKLNAPVKPAPYQPGDFKHLAKEIMADMFDQIENDLVNTGQPQKTDRH